MNEKGEIDAGDILRIISFFVGLGLLISGFVDLGNLGGMQVSGFQFVEQDKEGKSYYRKAKFI